MTPELPPVDAESASINSSMAAGDLVPGAIVDDQVEIISVIGHGGMAVVYQSRDLRMDRVIALKMLSRHLRADEAALKRFQREAVAVATLSHPNIISVYGFGSWNGQPYVSMELLDGVTLADLIHDNTQKLSLEYKIDLFLQILAALSYAHSKGVIHRDLKPRNIMLVNSNSSVKLLDFGIAKILPQSGKQLQTLTQTGELFGTVSYMSPEQCRGEALDARSDIYSMGCLMYEVLSGQPPFGGSSAYAVMAKHLDSNVGIPPCDDPDLSRVVLSALSKDPALRPQSAEVLAQGIRDPSSWIASQPATSKPRLSMPSRLQTVVLLAIIGCVLSFLFVSTLSRFEALGTSIHEQSLGRSSPGGIMDQVSDLFDRRDFAQAVALLEAHKQDFMEYPEWRKSYYCRLANIEQLMGRFDEAQANASQVLNIVRREKQQHDGPLGFDQTYADALATSVNVLLYKHPPQVDQAMVYVKEIRLQVSRNVHVQENDHWMQVFQSFANRLKELHFDREAQECMDASRQAQETYANPQ